MSRRIEIQPAAEKQYLKLDKTTRRRIKQTLQDIENVERPLLHTHVRPLTGQLKGDYRVRVGGWRLLLTPNRKSMVLHVYAILPRGDAY